MTEFHKKYHSVHFFCPLVKINFISDPKYVVNFPPKGDTTELPDQGYTTQGETLSNQTDGGANKVSKHLI